MEQLNVITDEQGNELGRIVPLNKEVSSMERADNKEMTELEKSQAEYDALQAQIAKLKDEADKIAEKIKRQLDDQAA